MEPHALQERMKVLEQQNVNLTDFESHGYVLDIGGGGDGIIGRLKENHVIAIDPLKEELEEAPDGPLKIIMDARNMTFLDNSFTVATCFCTLMYIQKCDHEQVFREIYRVLKPDGRLMIWDVNIPARDRDEKEDIVVVSLVIQTPKEEILAGYGVTWTDREQDIHYYIKLAAKIGFEILGQEQNREIFQLVLRKP